MILVDTDILIDVSRQVAEAMACVEWMETHLAMAISVITQMELLVGCRNKTKLRKTESFLKRFDIVKLNEQISDTATAIPA